MLGEKGDTTMSTVEASEAKQQRDKIRNLILKLLEPGPRYRLDLHTSCCRELGYAPEPVYNEKGNLTRVCREVPDNRFDAPLRELLDARIVRKYRGKREGDGHSVVFYELISS
jgi:hypothetical protein